MTNFSEYIDRYCERTMPGLFNEPLNLLTNTAFFIAALMIWRFASKRFLLETDIRILCLLIMIVGIGSSLFHTFALFWSQLADVIPIGIFVISFFYVYVHKELHMGLLGIILAYLWFFGVNGAAVKFLNYPELNGSQMYFGTLFTLLLIFLTQLHRNRPSKAWFGYATLSFGCAITARVFDQTFCPVWPFGTHFIWHIMNGVTIYCAMRALLQDRKHYVEESESL